MKINQLDNINFGYNKRLNQKLKQRLEENPKTPFYNSIANMNESCNLIEEQIKKLEGTRLKNIDKNESQIAILTDYLVTAKVILAKTIQRIFPDLNYVKIECDTYDEEFISSELPDDAFENEQAKKSYIWRETLRDSLETLAKDDSFYEIDLDEFEEENNSASSTNIKSQEKTTQEKSEADKLTEKFVPNKYSPKSLDDIVGLENIREDIKDLIIFPLENPQKAQIREEEYGIEIPHFVMFYGPPGCGKTMLAQAISIQSGCDMFSLDLSKVGSSYVNQTSSNISSVFEFVKNEAKKSNKPVILFLDEMDSILSKRKSSNGGTNEDNKAVNTLLTEISSSRGQNIIIIGATNMFNLIDPAVKRRIDLNAYIGLPSKDEIIKLVKMELSKIKKGINLANDDISIEEISNKLVGYSPSNIVNIIKASSKLAYKNSREITKEDVHKAIEESNWEKIKEQEYLPQSKKTVRKLGFGT